MVLSKLNWPTPDSPRIGSPEFLRLCKSALTDHRHEFLPLAVCRLQGYDRIPQAAEIMSREPDIQAKFQIRATRQVIDDHNRQSRLPARMKNGVACEIADGFDFCDSDGVQPLLVRRRCC